MYNFNVLPLPFFLGLINNSNKEIKKISAAWFDISSSGENAKNQGAFRLQI